MFAHSTPKTGVEWGTQSLGCLWSEIADPSASLGITKGGVALSPATFWDLLIDSTKAIVGLRPSFSAHVRWGERGAPVRFPPDSVKTQGAGSDCLRGVAGAARRPAIFP
jgi:hypothetical protein